MKQFSILIITLAFLFLLTQQVEAKVLPQAVKSGATTSVVKKPQGTSIVVTPKLRRNKKALVVYFSGLQNAKTVSYLLTYSSNGQAEGARGDLNLKSGSAQTSTLLFGTCSKNVCRYHTNIKDMSLEIHYTTTAGKKYLKKYKIRV